MKILVTFAVEAESAPWRKSRGFVAKKLGNVAGKYGRDRRGERRSDIDRDGAGQTRGERCKLSAIERTSVMHFVGFRGALRMQIIKSQTFFGCERRSMDGPAT